MSENPLGEINEIHVNDDVRMPNFVNTCLGAHLALLSPSLTWDYDAAAAAALAACIAYSLLMR